MRTRLPLLLLLCAPVVFARDNRGDHPDAPASTPQEQLAQFTVPPGFEVQLVADETQIQKPMNIAFDAAGRLWVTGSGMYPWPAKVDALGQSIAGFDEVWKNTAGSFDATQAPAPAERATDTVRILSDFGPDGRARKVEVFAGGLNIPIGIQPLPRKSGAKGDTAIVFSIPTIWRMEDTDGDGRADKKEALYTGFDFKDTHGMSSNYLYWIDGWIYGCHGFRNHSEVRDRAGRVTVFDSGNTYRFRPDGSQIEIYTHGQTNPFGLTVDPLGNFYSADSHSKPVMLLLRGGFYEGIGKNHDGLGFAPTITDDDHGSSAIAGIAYYAADQFPEEFRGNLFNGNPVTRRINRDRLEWHGSTPKAIRMPDFLTCDDPWFRPIQVKLGPDGALYIADFYNPIIGHYEFPLADPRRDHTHGRIWRVVWRGEQENAPVAVMPDCAKVDAGVLVKAFSDPNLVVRTLAVNELVDRVGKPALDFLNGHYYNDIPMTRPNPDLAIWAARRLGGLEFEEVPNHAAEGLAMLRIIADSSELSAMQRFHVPGFLRAPRPAFRRAAAEALSRHPSPENIGHILAAFPDIAPDDLQLMHALRMALRDNLAADGGYERAALVVQKYPQHADRLAAVSVGVKSPAAAEFLLGFLERANFATPLTGEYVKHAVRFLPPEKLGAVAGLIASAKDTPLPLRLSIADNLAQASRERGFPLPDPVADWTQQTMLEALASGDDLLLKPGIEAVRDMNVDTKLEPLARIADDKRRGNALRLAALEAAANLPASRDLLASTLSHTAAMNLRKRAAELLAQNGHTDVVLAALPNAPNELALSICAALAKSDVGAAALLGAIDAGQTSARFLANKAVSGPFLSRLTPLQDRASAMTRDLPPEDARLDAVIARRAAAYGKATPDATHGAQIFQQHCAVCHRFRNAGGNVGPNLDGVAARGPARLIEDILDPNRNVDPLFRQTTIETADGKTHIGANLRDLGETILLADPTGKDFTLPKHQIKAQTASRVSLMPPMFEAAIPDPDFYDLLAYLLNPPL